MLCVLSPICLMLLGGWSEYGPVSVTENMAGGLGTVILLLKVAAAVALFIVNGMKAKEFLRPAPPPQVLLPALRHLWRLCHIHLLIENPY